MYYDYFGLKRAPFKITPDPDLFFPGANRGPILQSLTYAIGNGEGMLKVVGEVGSGKTMLCRMLQGAVPKYVEIVYLANPNLPPEQLAHAIAFELKLDVQPSDNKLRVIQLLQEFLIRKHAENHRVVMFVEEAQSMSIEALEELRLLSNLETYQEKLLQIVLFGQPELDHKLAAPHIRQLRERITYSFDLSPLQEYEVRDYINARLRVSGYQGVELFTPKAIRLTTGYSHGLLRRINIIADKACLAAYAGNAKEVGADHVKRAVLDSEFRANSSALWPKAGIVALIFLIGVGVWFLTGPLDILGRKSAVPGTDLQPGLAPDSYTAVHRNDPWGPGAVSDGGLKREDPSGSQLNQEKVHKRSPRSANRNKPRAEAKTSANFFLEPAPEQVSGLSTQLISGAILAPDTKRLANFPQE